MKQVFPLVFILFLLIPSLSAGKVVDQIVGSVNGEVITLSDLDEAMPRCGKANILAEGNPLDKEIRLHQARREVLSMLIEEKLLQKQASQLNITVGDEDVKKAIEKMKEDGHLDDAQLTKMLAAQGFSLEGYHHFLTVQIERAKLVDVFIRSKISMSEEKLREYYQSHEDQYRSPEVKVSEILIQVPSDATPQDWETAKTKMHEVLQRIQKGATFEEMATLYSDDKASAHSGGDLGFFTKGEMTPLLEGVVFNLKVGALSEVLNSSQGLHLFKVTEKVEGPIPSFEQAKAQVMSDYYRDEVTKL